tara:strand:- start:7629 stop:8696 length:1068 start_codon:yes stop_codon:yes gene_type:complete
MADSYYQIATTPKLYVSYPLYQYASGALDEYLSMNVNWDSEGDMIKLLQIDPSNQVNIAFQNPFETNDSALLAYKIVPSFDDETLVASSGLWNFDFCMLLGHNFNTQGIKFNFSSATQDTNTYIETSNIVNYVNDSVPEYDGWSLINLNSTASDEERYFIFRLILDENSASECNLGSLLFGKSFEFPINTSLSTTTKFEYGIKQKSTISGKTISTANWTKPNNWITEPFGLGNQEGDNYQRRSGRRVWKMQFDSLAPDKVMNQNMMMNSNGFTAQDNHSTAADSVESLYNINDATDFYTNVVHRSMSSHLPMVLQIDKNDNSPSNFAIVRMNKDYTIKQKSPNLYSISVTLTEQI